MTVLFFVQTNSFAQLQKSQAAFIFNFALFINWPAEYQAGDFDIAVLGNSDIINELETMTTDKKIGAQSIKVRKLSHLKDLGKPNIIFVPDDQLFRLKELLKLTDPMATLVVTESEGAGQKGSTINFVFVANKLKFEINPTLAEKKGMKLPDKLIKLGVVVGS